MQRHIVKDRIDPVFVQWAIRRVRAGRSLTSRWDIMRVVLTPGGTIGANAGALPLEFSNRAQYQLHTSRRRRVISSLPPTGRAGTPRSARSAGTTTDIDPAVLVDLPAEELAGSVPFSRMISARSAKRGVVDEAARRPRRQISSSSRGSSARPGRRRAQRPALVGRHRAPARCPRSTAGRGASAIVTIASISQATPGVVHGHDRPGSAA